MARPQPASPVRNHSRTAEDRRKDDLAILEHFERGRARAWHPRTWTDLLVSTGLVLLAVTAALALPEGNVVRLGLTLPVLAVVPGYLLLQTLFVPVRRKRTRALHALIGVGVSPPVLGLLALSTALVPGGFTPGAVLAVIATASLVMGAVALWRRVRYSGREALASVGGPPGH